MKRRIGAIVQARMGSTRLPGKTLAPLEGRPLLWHVLTRTKAIPGVDEVVLATTERSEDQALEAVARETGCSCFFGSEDDVLDRFFFAAKARGLSAVVRVTADCPLIDPAVSGLCVKRFIQGGADYVSNTQPPTFPDGLDTEVFGFEALEAAWKEARQISEREHVTPFIWKTPSRFRCANVERSPDLSGLRWTVDEPRDLDFVRAVVARLGTGPSSWAMEKVLAVLKKHPELSKANAGLTRNEGYLKSLREDQAAAPRRKKP